MSPEFGALGGLLAIVAPVFAIILLGYCIGLLNIFSADQVRGFGRLVMTVTLPALIFNSLAMTRMGQSFRLDYLLAYGAGSLVTFAIGFAWFRSRETGENAKDRATGRAAVRAVGMSSSNTAFVGLPVLSQIYGPVAAGPAALNMLFENMLLLPLVMVLIEAGQRVHGSPAQAAAGIARSLVRAPLIWAIILGALFSLSGLTLPQPAARAIGILAGGSAPLALLTIGASLAGASLHGRRRTIATIAVGKLVLHPLIVLVVLLAIPVSDPVYRNCAILMAAMPMLSIFPVFAQRTGDEETCSAALLLATGASFVTLIGAMALLGASLPATGAGTARRETARRHSVPAAITTGLGDQALGQVWVSSFIGGLRR